MYKSDPLLLSYLYQSNRPGRIINVDLPKYLYLQNNNFQWGNQLGILFISIVYVVQIRPVQWFGDALIDSGTATELGLVYIHHFFSSRSSYLGLFPFTYGARVHCYCSEPL